MNFIPNVTCGTNEAFGYLAEPVGVLVCLSKHQISN